MKNTLDCRGKPCPQPVLRTRDALAELGEDALLEVLVDNPGSRNNVERFCRSQACEVEVEPRDGGCFLLRIRRGSATPAAPEADPAQYGSCAVETGPGLVCVFPADTMGRGNDELGWALLQAYVTTLPEADPLPGCLIFYNGGVRLVTEETKALEAIQAMERQGAEVLVCGTCLDFHGLMDKLAVGRITNMLEIIGRINAAAKVSGPL